MALATFTETVVRRNRAVVLAGLVAVVILSTLYTIYLAQTMGGMMDMGQAGMSHTGAGHTGMEMTMPVVQPWAAMDYWLMFVMWSVMMIAMMTPSAAPMILTYTRISQRQVDVQPVWGTALFYLGYLIIWTAYSAVATGIQGLLHAAALLSPMQEISSPILGGIILIAAGIFQFTPFKKACLTHCRTPMGYFMTEWRDGQWGALVMGLRHGAYCVGCCWLLMALLFVSGVMNLFWMGVITAYVLAEKVMPGGHKLSWAIGIVMLGWGLWMVAGILF